MTHQVFLLHLKLFPTNFSSFFSVHISPAKCISRSKEPMLQSNFVNFSSNSCVVTVSFVSSSICDRCECKNNEHTRFAKHGAFRFAGKLICSIFFWARRRGQMCFIGNCLFINICFQPHVALVPSAFEKDADDCKLDDDIAQFLARSKRHIK
jgi:hypothetical protein